MNKYYVRSIVDINRSRSIKVSDTAEFILSTRTSTFDFTTENTHYLKTCLIEMKNKKDTELISHVILMDAWPIIETSVCQIVNESLEDSIPDGLKVAPVPKVSRPKRPEDYRPINMLLTLEKLIDISEESSSCIHRREQFAVEISIWIQGSSLL